MQMMTDCQVTKGGHLIDRIFGGSEELDNLVAMNAIVNRSDYIIMENQWKNALQEGKEVQVTIGVVYDESNKRPREFNINYFIDGKEDKAKFSNGGA